MKEIYLLIKIKPKYAEQFCIMMIAFKEICNRAPAFKKFAKIDEVFSVLGPFDFLLELSGEGEKEKEIDEKINNTIFRIRKTLGFYIYETCTLTKYSLEDDISKKAKLLETKEKISINELDILGNYFKHHGGFGKLKELYNELNNELNYDGTNIENMWKKNKYLFDFENKYNEYLNDGIVDVKLKEEFNKKIDDNKKMDEKHLSNKAKLLKNNEKNWKLEDGINRYGIFVDTGKELKLYKIITKDVHVLINVKPLYTKEFFLAMTIFKSLCNRDTSLQDLAIIDEVCFIVGPFDFLLELSVVGGNVDEKINRTILKIRENLGCYINETVTIKKFKIPMTKEELENLLEKNWGYKHLTKLPDRNGEKIPDESFKRKCDLIDICDAETTSLKNLMIITETPEIHELKEQIDDLKNRLKILEQKFIQS